MPHLGWTNAVPDSSASASFTLANSSTPTFVEGSGYHDHNWGDIPFEEILSEWYWGRGRLGPWSFVFFQGSDAVGSPFANGYVAENGKILLSSCAVSSVLVTPVNGAGGDGDLLTLNVNFSIDSETTLNITITVQSVLSSTPGVYFRWTGSVSGEIQGQQHQQYHGGLSILERFPLATS